MSCMPYLEFLQKFNRKDFVPLVRKVAEGVLQSQLGFLCVEHGIAFGCMRHRHVA